MNYLHVISLGFFMIAASGVFRPETQWKRVIWLFAAIAVAIGSHWA